jgi:predicted DNA-binding transcriptional regulator YafY
MPRGDQLARQWRLLQLLDRPAGVTVADAARDLACAVRTIWRDLRVLQDAGFPIYDDRAAGGRQGVWKVEESFRASLPVKLTLAEVAALAMSRRLVLALGGALGPALASALDKVARVLSRDALALLERMQATVGVRALGAKLQQPAAEFLPAIQQALVEGRTLGVRYYSYSRDAETERDVDPYHLTAWNGGLYLVGYCHLRRAVRVFAVERFRRVNLRARRFEPPRDFDVERYLAAAWGILRGDLVTVRVRFARPVARYIRERLWHPSQRFRDLPDGRLEMTMEVADTAEVRRWILGWGTQAEVLEPAAMREALRQEALALGRALEPARKPLAPARPLAGPPSGALGRGSRSEPASHRRSGRLQRRAGPAGAE